MCYTPSLLTPTTFAGVTGPIQLQQKTPLRVLHRRPNLTRPRTIHSVSFKILNRHWFEMRCTAQAGAYIKEFVTGDFGRTTGSVSDLVGGPIDIVQLDVEGIEE